MQQYGFTGKISEFLQFIQSKDLDKKVGNKNLLETSWNIALYWIFPAVKNLFLNTFFCSGMYTRFTVTSLKTLATL